MDCYINLLFFQKLVSWDYIFLGQMYIYFIDKFFKFVVYGLVGLNASVSIVFGRWFFLGFCDFNVLSMFFYFLFLQVRRFVSDFGIVIVMVFMFIFDMFFYDKVITLKVVIGDLFYIGFYLIRRSERGWFINFVGMIKLMGFGWIFVVIVFVFFVGILLFMEIELIGVFLNKKENKFIKGVGFNLDLCVMGLLLFICLLMGLLWMCVVIVRLVFYLQLLIIWSIFYVLGVRLYIVEVKEQRIINIVIYIFTGKV